ncbi:MAG: hypothetical protein ACTS8R_10185 [Arsenophonus sp. NC-QC1-MAG3]
MEARKHPATTCEQEFVDERYTLSTAMVICRNKPYKLVLAM